MTGDLRDVRTQLLVAVAVLLIFDIAAIALLVSPAGRSRGTRQQQYEQLRMTKIEQTKANASTAGMDQKIATARQQEAEFIQDRLAGRYSAMSEQLSRIATEAGVGVSDVKYDEHPSKDTPQGFDNLGITIQVHGTYEQDMHFINEVERQKMLLLIDGVSFGGMQGAELTVSIHLSTYLRSAV